MKAPANTLAEIIEFRRGEIRDWSKAVWGRRHAFHLANATGFSWDSVYETLKGQHSRAGECLFALEAYVRSRGFVSAMDFTEGLTRLEVVSRPAKPRVLYGKVRTAPAPYLVDGPPMQVVGSQHTVSECEPSSMNE